MKKNWRWYILSIGLAAFVAATLVFAIFPPQPSYAFSETLRPNAAGDLTEWGYQYPETGEHWDKVDEAEADDDATYIRNWQGGATKQDLFNLPAPSGEGSIIKITLYFCVKDTQAPCSNEFYGLIKTGGTIYESSLKQPGDTDWVLYSYEWAANPDTEEAWTWDDITALQIGVKSYNASFNTTYCTQVYVEIDYVSVYPPTVTTQAATNIEATTATGNGNITDTGGANATTRGFDWDIDSGAPYTNSVTENGSYGTGAYTLGLTSLPTGTTIYYRAKAENPGGWGYGSEESFLTKPAAPTNVVASDGTYTDKVVITWTKSTGATGYRVYQDGNDVSGLLGDVATYDDTDADAPVITPGAADATDGSIVEYVTLSLSGEGVANGTTHTYKVVAVNATGNSADSATDTGYRGHGALTYQWQRSAADSDADYSNIDGATTDPYNDTGAPENGDGRYYKCVLDATGAAQQTSTADRGYRGLPIPPEAPTNVDATDGDYTDKVVITWTKSDGATDYQVYRDDVGLGWLGDVATYDDDDADAPVITPGAADATDGTSEDYVTLALGGEGVANGTAHTYKVRAKNAYGESGDSATDTGYRGHGAITYQWQRSAADSDADYSNIDGATTDPYNDTGAPENGDGRYYKCVLDATGAAQQTSTADRGFRLVIEPPVVFTDAISGLGPDWAIVTGSITSAGTAGAITQVGFDYGLTTGYGGSWSASGSFTTGDIFTTTFHGLDRGAVYHYRAKVYNGEWVYGQDRMFSTIGSASIYEYWNTGGDGYGPDIYANLWGYQQFTVEDAHTVAFMRLYLKKTGNPGTVTVSIRHADGSHEPTGNDIWSATLNGDDFSTSVLGYQFDITETPLAAGEYAVVVRAIAGDDSNDIQWQWDSGGGLDNAVAGHSVDGGSTWVSDTPADFLFEIWGYPCIRIASGAAFQNYLEDDDILFTIEYVNIFPPYYPSSNPEQYFDIQLLGTDGVTVLASTVCWAWGNMPGSIYLSADQASSIDIQGLYYLRLHGAFTGEPVGAYQLTSNDWQGTNLKNLDSWVILTAHNLEAYYGNTLTIRISGKGEVLNEEGGVIFQDGIQGLTEVRPDLFQIIIHVPGYTGEEFTDAFNRSGTWEEAVGPKVAGWLTSGGEIIGVDGKMVGVIILIFCWLGLAVIAALKGGSAFVVLVLAVPFFLAGALLHFLDIALIAIVASILTLGLIFTFWLSRT